MEDRYSETHQTWNRVAQIYEDKFMDLELYNDSYHSFCNLISETASILELGCGPGNISRHLLQIKPSLNILATDVSENMIALALKNNPNILVQVLDSRNVETLGRLFDGIIAGFLISYLSKEDCSKLIQNCTSKLSLNGLIYLSFVAGDYTQSGFIKGSSGDRSYFYFHEQNTIIQSLENNQMVIVNIIEKQYPKTPTIHEIHTIIIAKKGND